MSRYIAVDALLKDLSKWLKQVDLKHPSENILVSTLMIIEEQPTADVVPVVHGIWKRISPAKIYECSKCGKNVMTDDIEAYTFCHGCGARMEGAEE